MHQIKFKKIKIPPMNFRLSNQLLPTDKKKFKKKNKTKNEPSILFSPEVHASYISCSPTWYQNEEKKKKKRKWCMKIFLVSLSTVLN